MDDIYRIVSAEGQGFNLKLLQSRNYNTKKICIKSLDVVLGLVGGFASIVWGSLYYLMGGY